MSKRVTRKVVFTVLMAGLGLAMGGSVQAATVTGESSSDVYTVSSTDLLQRYLGSTDNQIILYYEPGYYNSRVPELINGWYGAASNANTCAISGGSVTYLLSTTFYPGGYDITAINTYTGWNDTGRVNQKYTVSFRKVGSATFGDAIIVDYTGTASQTYVNIADINLMGVDALRFTFPEQQNGGVGYKELDVIGSAPALAYVISGESSSSVYTVSGTDLLQTGLSSTEDALALHIENDYVNGGAAVLTDGLVGPASKVDSCAIAGGSVTYTLNTADYPGGYDITMIDTYTGWNDGGRDNQHYEVSFRRVGCSTFVDAITVTFDFPGTSMSSQTHVKIDGLGLTGVEAVRFTFFAQENGGVGYKELDVIGTASAYADVTRLEGSKMIVNDGTIVVRIIEGTGALGDITLEAPVNSIRSLTQSTTAGLATINASGQTLALNSLSLQADAGGLTIDAGMLMSAAGTALFIDNRSGNDLTLNAVVADGRGVATPLIKTGAGTLKLSSNNTYSGVTTFQGGVVEVSTLSNYGSASSLGKYSSASEQPNSYLGLLFRSGTLRYSGATAQSTDRAIRITADGWEGFQGGATLDASGSNPDATLSFTANSSPDFFEGSGTRSLNLTGSNTGNNLFGMAILETGGATSVTKSGSGTWMLTGANAYSGGTHIKGGTLRSSAVGSGVVTIATNATWDAGVSAQTIAGLAGSGFVTRPSGIVTTGGDGAAQISTSKNYALLLDFGQNGGATINGVAFTQAGTSGAGWNLTGASDLWNYNPGGSEYDQLMRSFYSGGQPGVLSFNNLTIGQFYNITIYTQNGVWGKRPQDATFTNGSDIHKLFNTEPGDLGYYSYYFTASAPIATIAMTPRTKDTFHWYGASLEVVAAQIPVPPVALTVGDTNNYAFAGVISGPTTLIKQGSGKLTLSGASTYTGATIVSAGTLEITKANTLPASTAVELNHGATLLMNNASEQTVATLTFGGVPQYTGTWGGAASNAQHKHAGFTGSGVLHVLTGPALPGTIISIS